MSSYLYSDCFLYFLSFLQIHNYTCMARAPCTDMSWFCGKVSMPISNHCSSTSKKFGTFLSIFNICLKIFNSMMRLLIFNLHGNSYWTVIPCLNMFTIGVALVCMYRRQLFYDLSTTYALYELHLAHWIGGHLWSL